MRAWLREQAGLAALVGTRVYLGEPPRQDNPELPMLVFYVVGGLPDGFGHIDPNFVVECWATNLHGAMQLGMAVAQCVMDGSSGPFVELEDTKIKPTTVNLGPVPSSGTSKAKRVRIDVSMRMRVV